jgi:hypothetical protein
VEAAPWIGPAVLEQAIAGMTANGQTNIFAGLVAAEEALVATPARIKHIILLTDGWSLAGAYDELTARLAANGITLSVVAAGNGSAEYLAELARKGGGEYYPAPSMGDVPQIFFKETIRAVGDYIIEEPFVPVPALAGSGSAVSPILSGIDLAGAGSLLGYNGTTPKSAARVTLLTPRGDPLLATWQYGLGRAVAWTSDLSGRWAKEWLAWEEFPRLAGQLVSWSLPSPADERLELATAVSAGEAHLAASVRDETGRPQSFLTVTAHLLDADGRGLETELVPTGAGRYEATVPLPAEGVYLAQVTAAAPAEAGDTPVPQAGRTTGLVAPYSAEYASLSADPALLHDITAATGGRVLTEPGQAFAHTLPAGRQTRPIWPTLLLLAALFFPVDVAIRRLRLSRREWQQAWAWLRQRAPGPSLRRAAARPAQPAPPSVQALRQARHRARQRTTPPPAAPSPAQPPTAGSTKPAGPASPGVENPAPRSDDEDTFSRLAAAKKRARR